MPFKRVLIKIVFDNKPDFVLHYFPKGNGGTTTELYRFVAEHANLDFDDFSLKVTEPFHINIRNDNGFLGAVFEMHEVPAEAPIHVTIGRYGKDPEWE